MLSGDSFSDLTNLCLVLRLMSIREGLPLEESEEAQEAASSGEAIGLSVAPEGATEADRSAENKQNGREGDATTSAATTSAEARQRAANAAIARLIASQQRTRRPQEEVTAGTMETSGTSGVVKEGGGQATSNPTVVSSDGARSNGADGNGKEVEVDMEGLSEIAGGAGARLLVAAGIKTLGQLADRDEEELAGELSTRRNGTLVEGGGCDGHEELVLDVGKVSEWVQAARGEELDYIMEDIVGSDDDVLEVRECYYFKARAVHPFYVGQTMLC